MTYRSPASHGARPSDVPGRTPLLLRLLRDRRRLEQHQRNLSYARRWVEATFVTLERLQRLVIRLTDDPGGGTTGSGVHIEVARLLDTRLDGRLLFAGTAAVDRAFDEDGHYLGDDAAVTHQLTDDLVLALGVSGRLFDPDPLGSVRPFSAVVRVAGNVSAADRPGVCEELDRFRDRIELSLRHLRHQRHQLGDLEASTADALIEMHSHWIHAHRREDTELRGRSAEVSVDATLSATGRVISRSFEDFLGAAPSSGHGSSD